MYCTDRLGYVLYNNDDTTIIFIDAFHHHTEEKKEFAISIYITSTGGFSLTPLSLKVRFSSAIYFFASLSLRYRH
jgi:hypothetical protein